MRRKEAEEPDPILVDVLKRVMKDIRSLSNCQSAGVRLQRGEDYPYYVYEGFPDFFIAKENSLCMRDSEGNIIRDSNGISIGECMCANVLRERFNPSFPFFTKKGSFWTNSTTQLLQTITEEQRKAIGKTRDMCYKSGYESVALIPMRADNKILGLVQLNDPRENMFTLRKIERYEQIVESIGTAVEGIRKVLETVAQIHAAVKG